MALIFMLSIECGWDRELAEKHSDYFDSTGINLASGAESVCSADVFQYSEDNWWAVISPNNVDQSGPISHEEADIMTEIGIHLYHRLLSSPRFRYAIVGVGVDDFLSHTELIKDLKDFPEDPAAGLVISDGIWEQAGRPPGLFYFREGYLWQTYKGEIFSDKGIDYKPLEMNSELIKKYNGLLGDRLKVGG
ncbi:hypothetical protein ACFL9U_17635 [Thermodesulfobacteriota bacterium]